MSDENPYYRSPEPTAPDARLDELDPNACWRHLESADVARLAVVDEFGPDIFPINCLVHVA